MMMMISVGFQSILDDVERFQSEVGSALGTEQLDADTLDQLLTSNILTKIDLPERNDLQRVTTFYIYC